VRLRFAAFPCFGMLVLTGWFNLIYFFLFLFLAYRCAMCIPLCCITERVPARESKRQRISRWSFSGWSQLLIPLSKHSKCVQNSSYGWTYFFFPDTISASTVDHWTQPCWGVAVRKLRIEQDVITLIDPLDASDRNLRIDIIYFLITTMSECICNFFLQLLVTYNKHFIHMEYLQILCTIIF
jgi:hypothetical protein